MWISVESVINFQGVKPKQFNLEKSDDVGLEEMLSEWIVQCQSLIETYTHREYTDENVPDAVKNVLLRLVSNMVVLAIQRRDSPIIKVNDWSISTISSDIFTDDLKDDLEPFVKASVSGKSDKVIVFAVTGEDLE